MTRPRADAQGAASDHGDRLGVHLVVAAGADLLIAEAYYRDKPVPYHLRLADLQAHQAELASRRIILTHLSADMLAAGDQHSYETASDGLTLRI